MGLIGVATICLTIVAVSLIMCYMWSKYIAYKTYEIRAKYPTNIGNVPYTQKNVWKNESTKKKVM